MSETERWLIEELREHLRHALESMTGESPVIEEWQGAPAASNPLYWWEQSFSANPLAKLWIGAPEPLCQDVGGRTLRAAGIEDAAAAEIQSTYQEILAQALSGLADAIGGRLKQAVACASGAPHAPSADEHPQELAVRFGTQPPQPLRVAFSAQLVALLAPPGAAGVGEAAPGPKGLTRPGDTPPNSVGTSKTLDLLLQVELPVSVSFGRAQLRLKDVIKLSTGSIVELNRSITEPVEIIVNNCLIARGEVVVIDGYYGVRIHQIISRQERLRTFDL